MKTLHFKADQLCLFHSRHQPANKHVALYFPPNFLCSINVGLLLYVWLLHWFLFQTTLLSPVWVSVTSSSLGAFFVLLFMPIESFHSLLLFMCVRAPWPLWLQCPLHLWRTRAQERGLAQLWLSVVPPCAWALLSPSGVRKSLLPVSAGKLVYPPPNPAFITLPK